MIEQITVSRELLRQVLDALKFFASEMTVGQRDTNEGQTAIDAPEQLRTALEQPEVEPIPQAVQTLIAAMQADPDYAWSWHCNIAMAYVDAGGDHYTGNRGAARFMKMLANVDPAHELPAPQALAEVPLKQIAEALRQHGLTLIKKANGYDVMKLGNIEAQEQAAVRQKAGIK